MKINVIIFYKFNNLFKFCVVITQIFNNLYKNNIKINNLKINNLKINNLKINNLYKNNLYKNNLKINNLKINDLINFNKQFINYYFYKILL